MEARQLKASLSFLKDGRNMKPSLTSPKSRKQIGITDTNSFSLSPSLSLFLSLSCFILPKPMDDATVILDGSFPLN